MRRKASFFERATTFGIAWAVDYAVVNWAFHSPHPGLVSYLVASTWTSLYYIEKATGAR